MINIYNEDLLKAFGLRLRELRNQQDLTQTELAEKAGITYSQIGRIERGEQNPTLSTIFTLSKALNVKLVELMNIEVKK